MIDNVIRNAAHALAERLGHALQSDKLVFKKFTVGIERILMSVSKLLIIYALSLLLGVFVQTVIIQFSFSLLKRYSLGLHALSNTVCTVVSCLLFVIIPWVLTGFELTNIGTVIAFIPVMSCLYLYAPADTKARPLIGAQLRTRFKQKAMVCGIIILMAALVIPNERVKLLVTIGAVYQVITILPLTYKILKRSERNYENYENGARGKRD